MSWMIRDDNEEYNGEQVLRSNTKRAQEENVGFM